METRNSEGNRELAFIGEQEPLLFDFAADRKKKQKASIMTNAQIRRHLPTTQSDMDDSKRYASATRSTAATPSRMACLALSMVAVPLGIQARRKETSTGLAISILVGLGYFLFFMIADSFREKARQHRHHALLAAQCYMPRPRHHAFLKARRK